MELSHICIVEVRGIELDKDTLLFLNNFIITNIARVVADQPGFNPKKFYESFGSIDAGRIIDGNTFIIYPESKGFNQNESQLKIQNILTLLWRVKDNSAFASHFYYIPLADEGHILRGIANVMTNSVGAVNKTYFSKDDIQRLDVLVKQSQRASGSLKPNFSKEMEGGELGLWHKVVQYDDLDRLGRGLSFIMNARKEGLLPLKITNNISFLECLFSTSTSEIQHQVAERASLFLGQYKQAFDMKVCYSKIANCYNIRSKYIHGDKLGSKVKTETLKENSIFLDSLCRDVVNIIYEYKIDIFSDDATIKITS